MVCYARGMFPVMLSERGKQHHRWLAPADFLAVSNARLVNGRQPLKIESARMKAVLIGLHALRKQLRSHGGEIRIYCRSPKSAQNLMNTIPAQIRAAGFVEVIGMAHHGQDWSEFRGRHVVIAPDGTMSPRDQKLLFRNLDKIILVIMGGGDGRSDQAFYSPVAKLMREILARDIGVWALCMSYQVLLDRVIGQQLHPLTGEVHIGTHIVDLTAAGKRDPVWSALGPAFGVEAFNHYRIAVAKDRRNHFKVRRRGQLYDVQVLGRDRATREIVAVKINDLCWAMQYHPELKKIDSRRIFANHPQLCERYHVQPNDTAKFFERQPRLVNHVGNHIAFEIIEHVVQAFQKRLGRISR